MILLIGDIHGCSTELLDLLDHAALGPDDEILAVGDIIDRGPDNQGVLDFFRHRPHASSILGNHERKHLRWSRGELEPALSQRITRCQLGDAYPDALAYLSTFPRCRDLPEALVVHGFWEPGIALEEQRDSVLIGTLSGEAHLQQRCDRPWYELYDGPKPLVVGHRKYRKDSQPFVYKDRVFGLDTGCCHGGRLTGLLLPAFRFVSVAARADYWPQVRRQFAPLVSASPG